MFNAKELQIIQWGKQNGKSGQEITDALTRFRLTGSPAAPKPIETPQQEQVPSLTERVSTDIQGAGQEINKAISGEGQYAGEGAVRRGTEAAAIAANTVVKVGSEALPSPVRSFLGKIGEFVGSGFKLTTDKIASTDLFRDLDTLDKEGYIDLGPLKNALGIASASGQVAGDILAAEGVRAGAQGAVDLTKAGVNKATAAVKPVTSKLISNTKELIKPTATAEDAIGEILQGKTKDIKAGVEALKSIDTEGVTTYKQLSSKIDKAIADNSGKVDAILDQDPTPIPLGQLTTQTTSSGGKVITRNYVQTALDNLKELYSKTADDAKLADVEDILSKAQATGLTRREVNDISRVYNMEFGSKAFSKVTGEPLTSVNAEMYENIRSGLKDVARQGMGGTQAEAIDKVTTSLYNTRDLVRKNVEAVNKLSQRVAERGLLEKAGNAFAKYGDMLTGGSIRGFVGGLLPRGAGYKVLNALDLEERLQSNLKIIQEALNSGSDKVIMNAAKSLGEQAGEVPSLLQRVSGVVSSVKDTIKDQRGFVRNPLAASAPDVEKFAKNLGGADVKLVQDFVEKPTAQSFMALQPILESVKGLDKLSLQDLQDFFREAFIIRNNPDFTPAKVGGSTPIQNKITGRMQGSESI